MGLSDFGISSYFSSMDMSDLGHGPRRFSLIILALSIDQRSLFIFDRRHSMFDHSRFKKVIFQFFFLKFFWKVDDMAVNFSSDHQEVNRGHQSDDPPVFEPHFDTRAFFWPSICAAWAFAFFASSAFNLFWVWHRMTL